VEILTNKRKAITVAIISENYPDGKYKEDTGVITGVEDAEAIEGVTVHYGSATKNDDGELISGGGRVLYVTASAEDLTIDELKDRVYEAANKIVVPGGHMRTDMPRDVRFDEAA